MKTIETKAYAKINLTLDILKKREDGYHEMCMVMQSVALCDELRLTLGTGKPDRAETNLSYLPSDERNLALQAAQRFFKAAGKESGGIDLFLHKRIPVCAGLGGGSSDAAAVLMALAKEFPDFLQRDALFALGEELGADVSYCMMGGTALATGRGEILKPLKSMPPCIVVLCKPDFPLSTKAMFSRIDCHRIKCHPDTDGVIAALEKEDLRGVTLRMYNVFEDFLGSRSREIAAMRQTMMDHGALGSVMSGSGPTVFGVFSDREQAEGAAEALRESYQEVFVTETC